MVTEQRYIEYYVERDVLDEEQLEEVAQRRIPSNKFLLKDHLKKSLSCSVQGLRRSVVSCMPVLSWLPGYSIRDCALGDLISGVSVGIMNLPQGMAYALLASVPPVFGLYTSFYPVLVYFMFGTSRHISIGTFAVISIMVGSVTEHLAPDRDFLINGTNATGEVDVAARDAYRVNVAATTSVLGGILQVLLGLVRFGFVATYLSEPLVRGYTTGATVHVVASQLKYLFGVAPRRFSGPLSLAYTLIDICCLLPETNVAILVVGVISLVALISVKELNSVYSHKLLLPIPIELIVIVAATLISFYADLSSRFDVDVVGEIPSGLKPPIVPDVSIFMEVVGDAFAIAIVSYAINMSLGKTFAVKHGYKVDSNQELVALGLSNVAGGLFQCFSVTSSMSRSLIQESTGGRTQVAGAISALVVLIAVLKLGPLFEKLPKAVLSTVVFVNLKGMFKQCQDIPMLWRSSKPDMLVWLVTLVSTLLLNLDLGLVTSIAFALLTVIFRTQQPKYSVLGWLPGTDIYLDIDTYDQVNTVPGITIFRSSSTIYFANAELYLEALQEKSGVDFLKRLTHKRKLVAKLQRQKKRDERKARKEAKKQRKVLNSRSGTLFSVERVMGQWKRRDGWEDENGGVQEGGVCDQADRVKMEDGVISGQMNLGYQDGEIPEEATLNRSDTISAEVTTGSPGLSPLDIHSIILDLSTTGFVDTVTMKTLKKIFHNFGEIDVDVYMAACQSCVVEQLECGGFFSHSLPKGRLFATVHDAVLHCLWRRGQSTLPAYVPDVACSTKL
ncbi:solute carrier family 26 member 6-like [Paramormyrops kingsleyae]|uniref:solute carrier family 26 member 6-like n=1 Tax=Paramormyrops kingsleyae TaxID=1676925 RepID=UPI000CD60081|nr:solute carrier family 26 member 6-like [Paramormyrops kingsleyae]